MGFDLRMRHIDGLSATQAPNRLPLRHLFCLPTRSAIASVSSRC